MQREFYSDGQIFSEGKIASFTDCTSRGSDEILLEDTHIGCVECVMGTVYRKVGIWKSYYKSGRIQMEGAYVVLDYMGLPNVKHGIWNVYYEEGGIFQQILFNRGDVEEITFFGINGEIIP